ncbi:unnamed protein product, partial [Amoebophrya sp. A120]
PADPGGGRVGFHSLGKGARRCPFWVVSVWVGSLCPPFTAWQPRKQARAWGAGRPGLGFLPCFGSLACKFGAPRREAGWRARLPDLPGFWLQTFGAPLVGLLIRPIRTARRPATNASTPVCQAPPCQPSVVVLALLRNKDRCAIFTARCRSLLIK